MRIGFDVDSVLNLLDVEWSKWIVENHDPTFTLDKWVSWDIHTLTPAGTKVFDYLQMPGVFRNCGVREGAKQVVDKLYMSGHEIFAVSSCDPPESYAEKCAWLAEHFPQIKKKNRIACSTKGLLKLDVLVDDGPHNFEHFDGKAVIFDRPWNRQYAGRRIYDLGQLLERGHVH